MNMSPRYIVAITLGFFAIVAWNGLMIIRDTEGLQHRLSNYDKIECALRDDCADSPQGVH